jgi:hypothetical protein
MNKKNRERTTKETTNTPVSVYTSRTGRIQCVSVWFVFIQHGLLTVVCGSNIIIHSAIG